MRALILSGFTALLLSACATGPTAYGPAELNGGVGFENTKIEQDRYRINFTGRTDGEARNYALLRAAEITLDEGFSHFRIVGGDTFSDQPRRSGVSTSVGFGTGRGYYGRGSSVGVGINLNDVGQLLNGQKVTNTIEVILLRSGSDEPNVYNAQSITQSIQPRKFQ